MKTVIMAGGKGTRIASLNAEAPKPMIPLCAKPILQWQIDCLKEQGYTDIILVIGHKAKAIRDYFGDGGAFGVQITYIEEQEPLGTAGALYFMKDQLHGDFLLINGDIIFDVDIGRFFAYHKACGAMATLFVHPNDHPYDSGVVVCDEEGKVTDWLHKEDKRGCYRNRVNAGLHFLSARVLQSFSELQKMDLDRDVLKPMIAHGRLFAYASPEYVKDMGTPDRCYAVERDIMAGRVRAKNLKNPQKAVFFDRDGTINRYVGFLRSPDDFELKEEIAQQIRQVNQSGYLAIVITNQPVIARGEVTWEQLRQIHNKMETLLGEQGAYVDDIFICPHHPDKGFPGERPEYKMDCICRKPKPGLLLQAAEKYRIDLSASFMVGDSDSDVEAGRAAGCTCVRVGSNDFR